MNSSTLNLNEPQLQPPLPEAIASLSDAQLASAIADRKARLGQSLIILGHHYQQDDVIRFADFTGDSFKLSQLAADQVKRSGARYVVFCGVHFMAESADVLAPAGTQVILPDLAAGCSMADMATYPQVLDAWDYLHAWIGRSGQKVRIIPICYMNSTAAIKAFCGEHGGAVCTSSNCRKILDWALAGGTQPKQPGESIKILFLPDQHLGRNTAAAMGYDIDRDMTLWPPCASSSLSSPPLPPLPDHPQETIPDDPTLAKCTFILWKGHCSVHMLFRPEHIDAIRAEWPDVKVIVHPECTHDVVQKADDCGSTERIGQVIAASASGTRWAVGTEVHMVNRLAQQQAKRGVTVRMLSDCQCLCSTMYRIDMPHLLWTLENLLQGQAVNRIDVDPKIKHFARISLERMLQITLAGQ